MHRSVTVHVLDRTTGEHLTSPHVKLYRIGVPGSTRAESKVDGSFLFLDLSAGEYSVAVYDLHYAPFYERFALMADESKVLELHLTPGGFLSGRVLDEKGQPPERCWFTLLRSGERRGKSGYITDSGDHEISEDGKFSSPPLRPARYFLRFAGLLRKPTIVDSSETPPASVLERHFDFLYPDAYDLGGALGFEIAVGEVISGLQVRIPRPVRHTVRGKVIGDLSERRAHISVMFGREIGIIDDPGGGASGPAVQADGTFEYSVLPGRYRTQPESPTALVVG